MTTKDGWVIGRENEVRILRALHRFGWLRTRDIAALVWQRWARNPASKPDLQPPSPTTAGVRMAQRTLKRLRDKRLVLSSRAPDGSIIYALSERGARVLKQIGVAAVTGKDLLRTFSTAHYRHRCIANEIAVSAMIQGYRVATEREIAKGRWLGGKSGIAGKCPDVLIRGDGFAWFVEVERSRKNAKDYADLLRWLGAAAQDAFCSTGSVLLGKLRWGKVLFICTSAFQRKLCRDLESIGWTRRHIESLIFFEKALYRFEDIVFS